MRAADPDERERAQAALSRGARRAGPPRVRPGRAVGAGADAERAAEAVAALARADIELAGFSLGQPTLDEVFLALTGHPAEEEEEVAA